MIASLSGRVLAKTPSVAIIDVNGVGYEVFISTRTYDALAEVDQACFLHVQTVVREDALMLYGFSSREEKELFLLLVTVSGIGPKLAQTILSGISVHELEQAILLKDLSRLTALPGVGKKTAQRICVELGEKVGALSMGPETGSAVRLEKDGGEGCIFQTLVGSGCSGQKMEISLLLVSDLSGVARRALRPIRRHQV